MPHILSIQSHVATGYVGNRAAVFPLQRLGCEVSFINTVQFSNHTGHGHWRGDVLSPEHIQQVIQGLQEHGALDTVDAVLSGYQGAAALGHIIVDTVRGRKAQNPKCYYCCDPVIGDIGRGVYVRPEVAVFIKEVAVKAADILTPNPFELGYLTGLPVACLSDIRRACDALHESGVPMLLVTSVSVGPDHIGLLLSTAQGVWYTQTPRFCLQHAPTGSGDATAAFFLADYLKTGDAVHALSFATSAIYVIFEALFQKTRTKTLMQSPELPLIEAQHAFVAPVQWFEAFRMT